jgi:two-component system cell cycle response regulator DivK
MRILYVEDNMVNVSLVRRIARGDELINYIDGEEALKNFDRDNPDLVLLDIQLAGKMTGLDVVRELRKQGCRLPIIAVTAYAMVGDREKCIEAGCDDYIAKPLPIPTLLELFERRRQEIAKQSPSPLSSSPTEPTSVSTPSEAKPADEQTSGSVQPSPNPPTPAEPIINQGVSELEIKTQSITETQETPKPILDVDDQKKSSAPQTLPQQLVADDASTTLNADDFPSVNAEDAIEK